MRRLPASTEVANTEHFLTCSLEQLASVQSQWREGRAPRAAALMCRGLGTTEDFFECWRLFPGGTCFEMPGYSLGSKCRAIAGDLSANLTKGPLRGPFRHWGQWRSWRSGRLASGFCASERAFCAAASSSCLSHLQTYKHAACSMMFAISFFFCCLPKHMGRQRASWPFFWKWAEGATAHFPTSGRCRQRPHKNEIHRR